MVAIRVIPNKLTEAEVELLSRLYRTDFDKFIELVKAVSKEVNV